MKKYLCGFCSILFIVLILFGCAPDPLAQETPTETLSEQTVPSTVVNSDNFENTLDGLLKYLKEQEYISGEESVMSAEMIGAEKGFRYVFDANGGKTTIEIYSYDPSKLNDTARDIAASVKATGKFQVLNLPESEALLLNSDRYLLVYKDTKLIEKNPPAKNKERKEAIIKAIDTFHASE